MNKLFLLLFVVFLGCGDVDEGISITTDEVILVPCPECKGEGELNYKEDDPIVRDLGFPTGPYPCPMCNGKKMFIKESDGVLRSLPEKNEKPKR
tara:strand:- start:1287 stop:1568 length:282 start_codon:yes stop_codon:yes gene_type:complete